MQLCGPMEQLANSSSIKLPAVAHNVIQFRWEETSAAVRIQEDFWMRGRFDSRHIC